MNSHHMSIDSLEEHYPVRARREVTNSRPPRRESPRFSARSIRSGQFNGAHRRALKYSSL